MSACGSRAKYRRISQVGGSNASEGRRVLTVSLPDSRHKHRRHIEHVKTTAYIERHGDQDPAFRFNKARLTLSESKIPPPRLYTCRTNPISPTTSVGTISRHNGASDERYLPDENMSREEPDEDAKAKVSKKEERESCVWEIMIRYQNYSIILKFENLDRGAKYVQLRDLHMLHLVIVFPTSNKGRELPPTPQQAAASWQSRASFATKDIVQQ